jgi:cell division protein FtsX
MSTGGRAAVAAGCLLCVTACGGSSEPGTKEVAAPVAQPQGCVVRVFFATEAVSGAYATRPQIRGVKEQLERDPRVEAFSFVSKKLALRRFAKKHPEMVGGGIPANPLPPSYDVVPGAHEDVRALEESLRGRPGVEKVNSARVC